MKSRRGKTARAGGRGEQAACSIDTGQFSKLKRLSDNLVHFICEGHCLDTADTEAGVSKCPQASKNCTQTEISTEYCTPLRMRAEG